MCLIEKNVNFLNLGLNLLTLFQFLLELKRLLFKLNHVTIMDPLDKHSQTDFLAFDFNAVFLLVEQFSKVVFEFVGELLNRCFLSVYYLEYSKSHALRIIVQFEGL